MAFSSNRRRGLLAVLALLTFPPAAVLADPQAEVDQATEAVLDTVAAAGLDPVVEIDHARLAAAEGVDMPPSRVQIFSDPVVNTALMADRITAGLDLPYRVLAHAPGDGAALLTTGSDFLEIRHGLTDRNALEAFDRRLTEALGGRDVARAPVAGLTEGAAILRLPSPYDVAESVRRLEAIVRAQADTVWFGRIDFQAEAAALGVTLPPAALLLFGGPAPGGVAMAEFTAIGLDAFCQKLLVYSDGNGATQVIYNDIAGLAELHYGRSAPPHAALNDRLTATFAKALE
ncbi:DUF302 domain-containing protein [Oceanomicrobium pacificus]|uniref:DUF302 domain-containing protein n=1 Tax=Oceanomicrobium pacificus TaxID=2692916 RepID=A0A6B0TMS5_9RHOB|nr:DUF302 domain-containing protein [Oceanomicrobium pacificus]MXU65156.1 DUF302 domain-containing protein [Oceanomicrobium pacificus]